MRTKSLIASTFTVLALLVVSVVARPQQEVGRGRLLVMKHGGVLQGTISRTKDYYIVQFGDQGDIRIAVDQVDMQCETLEQAYQVKQGRIQTGDAAQHLALADWCVRWKYAPGARQQLAFAKQTAPKHPSIPILQQRLEGLEQAVFNPRGNAAPNRNVASDQPGSYPVRTVAHEVSAEELELDRMRRAVSRKLFSEFATQIQPILNNGCAASHCHGTRAQRPFMLLRPSHQNQTSRRLTEKNLASVLQRIQVSQPKQSPLLVYARKAHGSLDRGVYVAELSPHYQPLEDWVQAIADAVSGQDSPKTPMSIPSATGSTAGSDSQLITPPRLLNHGADDPASSAIRPLNPVQTTESPTAYIPIDPFDPEIFNRRHHVSASGPAPQPSAQKHVPQPMPRSISPPHRVASPQSNASKKR